MKEESVKGQKIRVIQTVFLSLVLGAGVFAILGSGGGGGGAVGGNKILAKGGFNDYSTTAGYGGGGGYVSIQNGYGGYGGGGDIVIKRIGKANASFTFTSSESDADLGANPVHVTTDTTFAILSSVNEAEPATAGTPYVVNTGGYLFVSEGSATPDTTLANRNLATGLSVATGKTLTLPSSGNYITLVNDVINRGTIKTSDQSATQKDMFYLSADAYYGGSSSAVITAGTTPGQNGGDVILCTNAVFNKGSIDTSGTDNEAGLAGRAGNVSMGGECDSNPLAIENSGNIIAEGGSGSSVFSGNNGGAVALYTDEGHIYNSGDIRTKGGNGGSSGGNGGGNGAQVTLQTYLAGEIRNSGDIDTSGGDAASNTTAGYGGGVIIQSTNGNIVSSGDLIAHGGSGTGTVSSGNYGGLILVAAAQDVEYIAGTCDTCRAGNITLSGNLDVSGGNSIDGGYMNTNGGVIAIRIYNADGYPNDQSITLLGYGEINTSAGDGYAPNDAGSVEIDNRLTFDGAEPGTAGDIVNEADIIARGAKNLGYYNGSNGGSINLNAGCDFYCHATLATAKITNRGDIDTTGGDATSGGYGGGNNGGIFLFAFAGVENSGNITANGGNGGYGGNVDAYVQLSSVSGTISNSGKIENNGGTGAIDGGSSGAIYLTALYLNKTFEGAPYNSKVDNRGAISASGGSSDADGGLAGFIALEAREVSNRAALTADGGDADPATGGSTGGYGGVVFLNATGIADTVNSGTLSVSGGTGETDGPDGCTIIDGVTTGVCPG